MSILLPGSTHWNSAARSIVGENSDAAVSESRSYPSSGLKRVQWQRQKVTASLEVLLEDRYQILYEHGIRAL